MNTFEFIFYSIFYWIFFIFAIFYSPYLIYKSIKFGKRFGWKKRKIQDKDFYRDSPLENLIVANLVFLGGLVYYFGYSKILVYFEKANEFFNG